MSSSVPTERPDLAPARAVRGEERTPCCRRESAQAGSCRAHCPGPCPAGAFEGLQEWRLHQLSRQPVPLLDHPHSKQVLPDAEEEPPSRVPVSAHWSCPWKWPGSVVCALSPHIPLQLYEICPEPSLLQAPQRELFPPFLRWEMLPSLRHLSRALSWTLCTSSFSIFYWRL